MLLLWVFFDFFLSLLDRRPPPFPRPLIAFLHLPLWRWKCLVRHRLVWLVNDFFFALSLFIVLSLPSHPPSPPPLSLDNSVQSRDLSVSILWSHFQQAIKRRWFTPQCATWRRVDLLPRSSEWHEKLSSKSYATFDLPPEIKQDTARLRVNHPANSYKYGYTITLRWQALSTPIHKST